jgi:hypothetical protein
MYAAVALSSADTMRRDIRLVVPHKQARGMASVIGCDQNLALSGGGGYDAKILAELRTMRRRVSVHK